MPGKKHGGSATTARCPQTVSVMDLCGACADGNLAAVKRLVGSDNAGSVANQRTPGCEFTPLNVAAQKDRLPVVRWLLDCKANPDLQNKDGVTPFYIAAEMGHLDIVKHLAECKTNLDLRRKDGATPLCVAAERATSTL